MRSTITNNPPLIGTRNLNQTATPRRACTRWFPRCLASSVNSHGFRGELAFSLPILPSAWSGLPESITTPGSLSTHHTHHQLRAWGHLPSGRKPAKWGCPAENSGSCDDQRRRPHRTGNPAPPRLRIASKTEATLHCRRSSSCRPSNARSGQPRLPARISQHPLYTEGDNPIVDGLRATWELAQATPHLGRHTQ